MDKSIVLVCGSGELGSRYLQGIKHHELPLRIFVYDPSKNSLDLSKTRWDEVKCNENLHSISFHKSLEGIKGIINLCIVSTTANVRLKVVNDVSKLLKVENWILEKVLAQRVDDLDSILVSIGANSKAWVNTSRRIMPWHQAIKDELDHKSKFHFSVSGSHWGLACNAIHFLDLFCWWSKQSLENIDTGDLSNNWIESKRKNFWEIEGTLKAKFSGNATASLTATKNDMPVRIKIVNKKEWEINESDGLAMRSDGLTIRGAIDYQSTLTPLLIKSILTNGCCNLPSLEESVSMHKVLIKNLHAHWNEYGNANIAYLPIT